MASKTFYCRNKPRSAKHGVLGDTQRVNGVIGPEMFSMVGEIPPGSQQDQQASMMVCIQREKAKDRQLLVILHGRNRQQAKQGRACKQLEGLDV